MEAGLSQRAKREAATVPGRGGKIGRREAQWPRRICTGDLNEVDHDCAFGGVAPWPVLSEVSLSHPSVELLPGEVRESVSGGGGVDGSGPGLQLLLPLGRKGPVGV